MHAAHSDSACGCQATIEPNEVLRCAVDEHAQPATGAIATMLGCGGGPDSPGAGGLAGETKQAWLLGVEHGDCVVEIDQGDPPRPIAASVGPQRFISGCWSGPFEMSCKGALTIRNQWDTGQTNRGSQAANTLHVNRTARVWLLDEKGWDKISSELLHQYCGGLSRLLPVLAAAPVSHSSQPPANLS